MIFTRINLKFLYHVPAEASLRKHSPHCVVYDILRLSGKTFFQRLCPQPPRIHCVMVVYLVRKLLACDRYLLPGIYDIPLLCIFLRFYEFSLHKHPCYYPVKNFECHTLKDFYLIVKTFLGIFLGGFWVFLRFFGHFLFLCLASYIWFLDCFSFSAILASMEVKQNAGYKYRERHCRT